MSFSSTFTATTTTVTVIKTLYDILPTTLSTVISPNPTTNTADVTWTSPANATASTCFSCTSLTSNSSNTTTSTTSNITKTKTKTDSALWWKCVIALGILVLFHIIRLIIVGSVSAENKNNPWIVFLRTGNYPDDIVKKEKKSAEEQAEKEEKFVEEQAERDIMAAEKEKMEQYFLQSDIDRACIYRFRKRVLGLELLEEEKLYEAEDYARVPEPKDPGLKMSDMVVFRILVGKYEKRYGEMAREVKIIIEDEEKEVERILASIAEESR
ncbi:hypothetical protein OCU04_008397 [Sclerotinia nivalis]|uniref:Uncharacterized protein n=1 Tax=Sclerotinia nivalis TaxID=352851 RepID=A0A9X0AI22_9HELO|nr:hypothetical protein OCU04_008397 [Sclerotinia nivalis]